MPQSSRSGYRDVDRCNAPIDDTCVVAGDTRQPSYPTMWRLADEDWKCDLVLRAEVRLVTRCAADGYVNVGPCGLVVWS
jgi:hypothetical protein